MSKCPLAPSNTTPHFINHTAQNGLEVDFRVGLSLGNSMVPSTSSSSSPYSASFSNISETGSKLDFFATELLLSTLGGDCDENFGGGGGGGALDFFKSMAPLSILAADCGNENFGGGGGIFRGGGGGIPFDLGSTSFDSGMDVTLPKPESSKPGLRNSDPCCEFWKNQIQNPFSQ